MWDTDQIGAIPEGVAHEEWLKIGQGLRQRMALMEALAQDVYGPQSLLQNGWMPAALAIGHGGHLPVVRGISPAGGRWLGMAGFALAHTPTGWQVSSVSTRCPRPLTAALKQALLAWAHGWSLSTGSSLASHAWVVLDPQHQTAPVAVSEGLWWAGPQDLEVCGTCLRMRHPPDKQPVGGLIHLGSHGPVDPLEQNDPSNMGIAGLLQSWRLGQFMMLNAPGLSFLDSPAWLGFMAPLSRHLFQQDLWLPSLPTWWCGEAGVLEAAMDLWAEGCLYATYPDDGLRSAPKPLAGLSLSAGQREAWRETLHEQGEKYTLQATCPEVARFKVVMMLKPDGTHNMVWTPEPDQDADA